MASSSAPNSYRDPFWSGLASNVEQKLELPAGLLVAIITKGEKSNADQVSEAGARSPFQIIPATRKAAIEKWGVDPYLSPENAAEVAGRLLQDSLKRNGGDPALAVAEYHGGTNRDNWGPRTKSYVQRVVGAQASGVPDQAPAAVTPLMPDVSQPMVPGTSTFDRLMAQMGKPTESAMASVFNAYQSGQMAPADAQQFEADVKAGRIMLPRGAALKAATPQAGSGGDMLPAGVIQAYQSGAMQPADRAQLEQDLRTGLVRLPENLESADGMIRARVPGAPQVKPAPAPEPGVVDKVIGAGEAALTAITGATGGAVGMIGGGLSGAAKVLAAGEFGTPQGADAIEQAAGQGAQALTYAPRSESGQNQAAAVGQAMQQVLPVAAVAPAMIPAAGAARGPGAPAAVLARAGIEGTARDAANLVAKPAVALGVVSAGVAGDAAAAGASTALNGAQRVGQLAKGVTTLPRRALEALRGEDAAPNPTLGTQGSMGAAGTDMATMRRATAENLPIPLELTKGQASRDAAQLKFEVETAKLPELGAPLRQRQIEQNSKVLQNFDVWIDKTGAEAPNLRAVGQTVDRAIVEQAARDKAAYRAAYKAAENAGEMEAPVLLDGAVSHLNEAMPDAGMAPILTAARNRALRYGVAVEGQNGDLLPQPVSLKVAERFRQNINNAVDYEPQNIRQATILKGLIDEATDGMGGNLYKAARSMRARFAQNYENHGVISKIVNLKRGSADRQVAFEDVFQHSVLKGSLDDVRQVRRVLHRSGEGGAQAWRELQGSTATWLRDEAFKNVTTDSSGNRVLSPASLDRAIKTLDADGKLDFVFGKRGAQQMRDVRDLAQYIRTVPPEAAVNLSNTAVTLMAFGDIITSGLTGTPAPLLTGGRMALKYIRDRGLRHRIDEALNRTPTKRAPNSSTGDPIAAPGRTIH